MHGVTHYPLRTHSCCTAGWLWMRSSTMSLAKAEGSPCRVDLTLERTLAQSCRWNKKQVKWFNSNKPLPQIRRLWIRWQITIANPPALERSWTSRYVRTVVFALCKWCRPMVVFRNTLWMFKKRVKVVDGLNEKIKYSSSLLLLAKQMPSKSAPLHAIQN